MDTHDITCFDISPSSDLLCFGSTSGVREWAQKADPRANDVSYLNLQPFAVKLHPSFAADENT